MLDIGNLRHPSGCVPVEPHSVKFKSAGHEHIICCIWPYSELP